MTQATRQDAARGQSASLCWGLGLVVVAFLGVLLLADVPARLLNGERAADLLGALDTTQAAMWQARDAALAGHGRDHLAAGHLEQTLTAAEAQAAHDPHLQNQLQPLAAALRGWLAQAGGAPAARTPAADAQFLDALRHLDTSRALLQRQTLAADKAALLLRSSLIAMLAALSLLTFLLVQLRRRDAHPEQPVTGEQRLATALDVALAVSDEALLIADPDDYVQHMNPAAETFTGWPAAQARGRSLREVLPLSDEKEQNGDGATRLTDYDGRHLRLTQHGIPLGEAGQGRLLRLRRDDQAPVGETDEIASLSSALIDALPGIFFLLDDELHLLRWNRSLARLSEHPPAELAGKPLLSLCTEDSRTACLRQLQQALHTGSARGETRLLARGGGIASFALSLSRLQTAQGVCLMGIGQDVSERHRAEARVERLAYFDPLTNLPNRRLLIDRLEHEIRAARRHHHYGALLFLDLDHFKTINDALGHSHGDALLRQVAERLSSQVRGEDTVARLGGDEFVVILPALDAEPSRASRQAGMAAEKIRQSLALPYDLAGHHYHLSVSIGIGLYAPTAVSVEDILKHADNAMYRAKGEGRNTIRHFEPGMQTAADARLALEKDLRAALEKEQLQLVYQLQVDETGGILGAEALLRWQHPQRGLVPTEDFIEVAEETGLILDIGGWVLRQAAAQLQHWCAAGDCPEGWRLAINISPRQFRAADFVAQVGAVLAEYGVAATRLRLEITEGLAMHDAGDVLRKSHALAATGISLALDDFGTGCSSLAHLQRLPIDQVKIDQTFVHAIGGGENEAVIVEAIIAMAGHLGIDIIAEGVETAEELDFLQQRGCPAFQGYYFGPLLPAEQVSAFLARGRISLPMG